MKARSWYTRAALAALVGGGLALPVLCPERLSAGWWPWRKPAPVLAGVSPTDVGGSWYWMRSPEQEQRVLTAHYNRYCIRCHGVDGRGVWDIPDVPDLSSAKWQISRSDAQLTRAILEGRGACMPAFRGTLTLEESWAMARYLRSFVPGSETPRPDTKEDKKDQSKEEKKESR